MLLSNRIAFGKHLLNECKACVTWHPQTFTQKERRTSVCLRCNYGFPNSILFDYKRNSAQPTDPQAHQLTNSSTHKFINPQAHQPTSSSTHKLINPHKLINSSTQKLVNSDTHQLKCSPTNLLKSTPTHQLKNIVFILQLRSDFHSVLAKIKVKK